MTDNNIKSKNEIKPTDKSRFEPAEQSEVSLDAARKTNSAEGLYKDDKRFSSQNYDLTRRYTEDDFADGLTQVNKQQLPLIPAPEGFTQRWVSAPRDGEANAQYSRNISLGWQPRPLDSIPAEFIYMTNNTGKASSRDMGIFQVAEMILMIMPQARRNLNAKAAARAVKQVTAGVGGAAQGGIDGVGKKYGQMTIDRNDIEVTSGGGKVPPVAD